MGAFSFFGLILFLDGIINGNLMFASLGLGTLIWLTPFFIRYTQMVGNTYCSKRRIIRERVTSKKANAINKKLEITFGITSIKFTNENTIYLDKENDTNNVMESIYNQARESTENKTVSFPFLYEMDGWIKQSVSIDNEKIEITKKGKHVVTVYNKDVKKAKIQRLSNHRIVLHIFCEDKKRTTIPLNRKTGMADIEQLYLLERFFTESRKTGS